MQQMPRGGQRLGRYRIAHKIGAGGSGVVYFGVDDAGLAYAIKVLHENVAADPDSRRRLLREMEVLRRISHPAVAEVTDADIEGPTPYIVTRYLPARSLQDVVDEHGPLGPQALVQLGNGMGQALAAIHGNGVIHRDLKPANVLMLDNGDPVLIDFGIAHMAEDVRLTRIGQVMGTPGYVAPEALLGDRIDASADWWAWSATMAFAATGRPPFGPTPVSNILDRVRRGDPDLRGAPAGLVTPLTRSLSPDLTRRPKPQELRVALLDLTAPPPPAAAPAPAPPSLAPADAPTVRTVRLPDASGPDGRPATVLLPGSVPPVNAPAAAQVWRTSPAPAVAATALVDQPQQFAPTRQMPTVAPTHQFQNPQQFRSPQQFPATQQFANPPTRQLPAVPVAAPHPQAPAQQHPAQHPPAQQPFYPPARSWSVLLCGVALSLVTGIAPTFGLFTAFVIAVLARTVERSSIAIHRRRLERGPARRDPFLVALGSPYHLLRAALHSAFAALLPLLIGASVLYILSSLAMGAGIGLEQQTGVRIALAAAATYAAGWWGPGGLQLRRGSRTMIRALSPGRSGAQWLAGAGCLLVVAAAIVLSAQHGVPDWSPLTGPPFTWLGW